MFNLMKDILTNITGENVAAPFLDVNLFSASVIFRLGFSCRDFAVQRDR